MGERVLGVLLSDRLFRQKRIGKTYAEDYWNDLQRTRNSNEQRGAPGQPLSALHREKIRASLKGYSKGVPKSEEHRRKISRALQVIHWGRRLTSSGEGRCAWWGFRKRDRLDRLVLDGRNSYYNATVFIAAVYKFCLRQG